jgi:hypothetical protein
MLKAWKYSTTMLAVQVICAIAARGYGADWLTTAFTASIAPIAFAYFSQFWMDDLLFTYAGLIAGGASIIPLLFLAVLPAGVMWAAAAIATIAVVAPALYRGSRRAADGYPAESQIVCGIALLPFGIGTVFGGLLYLLRRRTA